MTAILVGRVHHRGEVSEEFGDFLVQVPEGHGYDRFRPGLDALRMIDAMARRMRRFIGGGGASPALRLMTRSSAVIMGLGVIPRRAPRPGPNKWPRRLSGQSTCPHHVAAGL